MSVSAPGAGASAIATTTWPSRDPSTARSTASANALGHPAAPQRRALGCEPPQPSSPAPSDKPASSQHPGNLTPYNTLQAVADFHRRAPLAIMGRAVSEAASPCRAS